MDTIIDLLERAVAEHARPAGADHQAWLQDADLDLCRYRPPGPARGPGAARSRRAARRSGPDLGRQPPGVGHRLPRRAVGRSRARAGRRPHHRRAGHQDRGADRVKLVLASIPTIKAASRLELPALTVESLVDVARDAQPLPRPTSGSGRPGRDRLHLGHHRRSEGRDAQPSQHHHQCDLAARRGAAGAGYPPALDPAAVAHVRAESRASWRR